MSFIMNNQQGFNDINNTKTMFILSKMFTDMQPVHVKEKLNNTNESHKLTFKSSIIRLQGCIVQNIAQSLTWIYSLFSV